MPPRNPYAIAARKAVAHVIPDKRDAERARSADRESRTFARGADW